MESKPYRISKENAEWLLKIASSPNKAITKLRLNDELTVSQFSELNTRINKIEKDMKEIKEFISSHSGGY